jgi:hypothetical protein
MGHVVLTTITIMKEPPLCTSVREIARRPLRIFPFDPAVDRFHDPIVSTVPYERVDPGPVGPLVEVVDFDTSTNQWLSPLDLNSPEVLIGLSGVEFEWLPLFPHRGIGKNWAKREHVASRVLPDCGCPSKLIRLSWKLHSWRRGAVRFGPARHVMGVVRR